MSAQNAKTVYTPPTRGVFAVAPSPLVPYLETMGLDQPLGILAVSSFFMIGLTYGACMTWPLIPAEQFFTLAFYLNLWAFLMRGAFISFNDVLDFEHNARIFRMRFRPVAREAITKHDALRLSSVLLILGLSILLYLPMRSHIWAITNMAIMMMYPSAERTRYYPSVFLGMGVASAVFQGMTTVGISVSPGAPHFTSVLRVGMACALLVMIMDTVDSFQDVREDAKAGAKSLPLLLGDKPKTGLWIATVVLEYLLISAGSRIDFSPLYYLIPCGALFFGFSAMLLLVDLKIPGDCRWWVDRLFLRSLLALVWALFVEYFLRLWLLVS